MNDASIGLPQEVSANGEWRMGFQLITKLETDITVIMIQELC